jgi:hypothetical protein
MDPYSLQHGVTVQSLVALYGPNVSVAALVAQFDADNPPGGMTGPRFLAASELAAASSVSSI